MKENKMKNTAIIIPTYNELDNIERLIKEIKKKVKNSTIFIVDDSKKNDIGRLIFNKKIKVKYFHRKKKYGRGSAVLYGLKEAIKNKNNKIFIEMDADFSHDPKELINNIKFFKKKKLDLLIASRYLKNSKIINWSISRRIFSKLSNFLARNLLQIILHDFTNGFRIYSKRSTKKIIQNCGNIGDGFIILSEIIVVLHNNGFKIDEVSSKFVNRKRGESSVNISLIFASLFGLLKLVFIKHKLK
jgi:dolichol-phosphate mannosyltransferase|tara:strand:- start:1087 stop:1818 length:732 start_codon:yes stop_codon:yes gene_type:complete